MTLREMPGATDDRRFLRHPAQVSTSLGALPGLRPLRGLKSLPGLGTLRGLGSLDALPERTSGRRATAVLPDETVRGGATLGQGGIGTATAGLDVSFVDLEIWHLVGPPYRRKRPCALLRRKMILRALSAPCDRLW